MESALSGVQCPCGSVGNRKNGPIVARSHKRGRECTNMKMKIDCLAEKISDLASRMVTIQAYMLYFEICDDGRRWLSEEELKSLINCDA